MSLDKLKVMAKISFADKKIKNGTGSCPLFQDRHIRLLGMMERDRNPVPQGGLVIGKREIMDEEFYFCVDC